MTTTIIMPGIRHIKPDKDRGKSALERGLFKRDDTISDIRTCEPKSGQINMLSEVDPLTYYCAFVMVETMDFHLRRGEHYRIGERYCRTLDEVVNALRELSG